MISPFTRHIDMMIIDFSGTTNLEQFSQRAIDLFREHASGEGLSYRVIA
jgi:hypothetical protein